MSGTIHIMDCPHCGKAITKSETRGAPKVFEADLVRAIQSEGENADQRGVAKALDVSARTLRSWLSRNGKPWRDFRLQALRSNAYTMANGLRIHAVRNKE